MVPSQSWKNKNLEDLYKYPWFFGELSEENAKEILVEAKRKDTNSEAKSIIFLRTAFDDIKKIHFNIVLGHLSQHDANVSFSSCQRNLIKTFQIEGMIALITKMTLILPSGL